MERARTMGLTKDKVVTKEMLDEYYSLRGWTVDQGIPTKDKLTELGLEEVAEDLAKRGLLST